MKIKTSNLDRLFSQYIRLKANNVCKACKKMGGLVDCAHIVSRRSAATRWLEDNAVCLCRGCHMFYGEHPHDWAELTYEWLGKRLNEIRVIANNARPPKILEKIAIGEDLIQKIKALGEKPICGIGKIKK